MAYIEDTIKKWYFTKNSTVKNCIQLMIWAFSKKHGYNLTLKKHKQCSSEEFLWTSNQFVTMAKFLKNVDMLYHCEHTTKNIENLGIFNICKIDWFELLITSVYCSYISFTTFPKPNNPVILR